MINLRILKKSWIVIWCWRAQVDTRAHATCNPNNILSIDNGLKFKLLHAGSQDTHYEYLIHHKRENDKQWVL
jgi:hypothetical protein